MDELDRLIGEYNAAVANGLIIKARRIDRIIKSIEDENARQSRQRTSHW